nr:hypothetical protein JVH1_6776 [Rhodococcus sp. JVH1]
MLAKAADEVRSGVPAALAPRSVRVGGDRDTSPDIPGRTTSV